jgi:hypothetical protein
VATTDPSSEVICMRASIGDRLCVHGRTVDRPDRMGDVMEVRGPDGQPPYLVRFDDGHERLIFPGPDCEVQPAAGA